MFNIANIFKGFQVAAAVAGILSTSGKPVNLGETVDLLSQIAVAVDPNLSTNRDYLTVQKVLLLVAKAEASGASGVVASVPFSSHGKSLKLSVVVEAET